MATVKEQFGSLVFDDRVMKASLGSKDYASLKKTIDEGKALDLMVVNAAVAESLKIYADRLEGAADFENTLHEMIKKTIKDHKRIIFNGYDDAWIKEATEVRGLCNYRTTADGMSTFLMKRTSRCLNSQKVFSQIEPKSGYEIMLENYCKTVIIEANTMVASCNEPAVHCLRRSLDR